MLMLPLPSTSYSRNAFSRLMMMIMTIMMTVTIIFTYLIMMKRDDDDDDDDDDGGDQEPSGRRMPIARCKPISINQEEGGLCN